VFNSANFSKNKLLQFLVFTVMLSVVFGCAQIVTPNGGKVDSAPPKVLSVTPLNKSLNFQSKKIEFVFDEYITLKDAQKQLIISPPLKNTPELKIRGKKLIVEFDKDTLLPNTTYNFNFGEAVADITEGNSKKDLNYIFSTGPAIDTFKLTGTVVNSETFLPEEKMFVGLWVDTTNTDSLLQKYTPTYITKVTKTGDFTLEYLKKGNYKLAAIEDANNNLKYDVTEEKVAFNINSVLVSAKDTNITLLAFKAHPDSLLIKKKNETQNYLQLVFNKKHQQKIELQIIQNSINNWASIEKSAYNDTLTALYTAETKLLDSLNIIIKIDNKIIDTVDVNLKKYRNKENAGRAGKGDKEVLKIEANNIFKQKFLLPNDTLQLKFSSSILNYDSNKIFLLHKKDTIKFRFVMDNNLHKIGKIISTFEMDSTYSFIAMPKAFKGTNGIENDTCKFVFSMQNIKDLGTLKLTLKLPKNNKNYIVDLLNGNAIAKRIFVKESTTINYKNLQPATYTLKIIEDSNNNGYWDVGNYNKQLQSEKIIKFKKEIAIRANWDLEELWELE